MMFAATDTTTATVPSGRHSITSLFDAIGVAGLVDTAMAASAKGCFAGSAAAARRPSVLEVMSLARQLSNDIDGSDSAHHHHPAVPEADDHDEAAAAAAAAAAAVWAPGCVEAATDADAAAEVLPATAIAMEVDQLVPGSVVPTTALASRSPKRSFDAIFTVIDSTLAVSDDGGGGGGSLPGSPSPVPGLRAVRESPGAAVSYRPRLPASSADRKNRKKASNRRAAAKFRQKKKLELDRAFAQIQQLEASNAAMQRELQLIRLVQAAAGTRH